MTWPVKSSHECAELDWMSCDKTKDNNKDITNVYLKKYWMKQSAVKTCNKCSEFILLHNFGVEGIQICKDSPEH